MKPLKQHIAESFSVNESKAGYLKFAKGKASELTYLEKNLFNGCFPIVQKYAESKRLTAYIISETEGHRRFGIEADKKRSVLTADLEKKLVTWEFSTKDEDNLEEISEELKEICKKYEYKYQAKEAWSGTIVVESLNEGKKEKKSTTIDKFFTWMTGEKKWGNDDEIPMSITYGDTQGDDLPNDGMDLVKKLWKSRSTKITINIESSNSPMGAYYIHSFDFDGYEVEWSGPNSFPKKINESLDINESKIPLELRKFMDAVHVSDSSIKLKDITVEASPSGNWVVYNKGKKEMIVNRSLLSDEAIMKNGLEHH